jgi:hypothetical protein
MDALSARLHAVGARLVRCSMSYKAVWDILPTCSRFVYTRQSEIILECG